MQVSEHGKNNITQRLYFIYFLFFFQLICLSFNLQLQANYGGHIMIEYNVGLTITDSLFDGALVTRDGGHINIGPNGGCTVYIKNSQFYRSSGAGNGGFLIAVLSTVTLIDVISDSHTVCPVPPSSKYHTTLFKVPHQHLQSTTPPSPKNHTTIYKVPHQHL